MYEKQLGEKIKKLRNDKGLSQEKFAILIDMDRTYFATVEMGKRNVSLHNIEKIAKNMPKDNCVYKEFSLADGEVKQGPMNWAQGAGEGTKKNRVNLIDLDDSYPIIWTEYSKIDDTNTGTFWCLVNKISKRS